MDSNVVHRLVKEAPKLRNKLNFNKVEVSYVGLLPLLTLSLRASRALTSETT